LAAGLPVSKLADTMLIMGDGIIDHGHCGTYIHAVQQMEWFKAAIQPDATTG
jgi:hypothetical protein